MNKSDWINTWLAVVVAVSGFIIFACLLNIIFPETKSIDPALRDTFLIPALLMPEPRERTLYVIALFYFPFFFATWSLLIIRWHDQFDAWIQRHINVLLAISLISIIFVLLFGMIGDGFFYWRRSPVYQCPWLWAISALACVVLFRNGLQTNLARTSLNVLEILTPILLITVIILSSLLSWEDFYTCLLPDGHFELVFLPSVKVNAGLPLLQGCGSQYGFYAHILEPVFYILGLDVFRFSLVMSVFIVIVLLSLLLYAHALIRSRWLATGFWGFAVVFSFLTPKLMGFEYTGQYSQWPWVDPYFQYLPIRLLFPALSLALCTLHSSSWISLRSRSRTGLKWFGHLLLALGIIWNLDSGILALGVWSSYLIYRDLYEGNLYPRAFIRAFLRVLEVTTVLISVLAAFTLYYQLRYGFLPDLNQAFVYQRLYYLAGFMMLPLRIPHTWVTVVLVPLLGLSWSIHLLFNKRTHEISCASLLFAGSVLSVGLFSYYQGRSHDWVMFAIIPLPILLAGFFADQIPIKRWRWAPLVMALLLLPWLTEGLRIGYEIRSEVSNRLNRIAGPLSPAWEADASFLRQHLQGKSAWIMSYNAATFYALSGAKPSFCQGLQEILTRPQLQDALNYLENSKGLLMFDVTLSHSASRAGQAPLLKTLFDYYKPVLSSPTGRWALMQPKNTK